jgi:hypothetical protein
VLRVNSIGVIFDELACEGEPVAIPVAMTLVGALVQPYGGAAAEVTDPAQTDVRLNNVPIRIPTAPAGCTRPHQHHLP